MPIKSYLVKDITMVGMMNENDDIIKIESIPKVRVMTNFANQD